MQQSFSPGSYLDTLHQMRMRSVFVRLLLRWLSMSMIILLWTFCFLLHTLIHLQPLCRKCIFFQYLHCKKLSAPLFLQSPRWAECAQDKLSSHSTNCLLHCCCLCWPTFSSGPRQLPPPLPPSLPSYTALLSAKNTLLASHYFYAELFLTNHHGNWGGAAPRHNNPDQVKVRIQKLFTFLQIFSTDNY